MGMNNKKNEPFSEINVTPFVDVMLVLLIIFMIASPLMFNGIKLDLPKTREVNPINLSTEQVILSMSKARDYFIGKEKVLEAELIDFLKINLKQTKTSTVFLRADYALRYGEVAKLMSFLKAGGISQIALVTEIEEP